MATTSKSITPPRNTWFLLLESDDDTVVVGPGDWGEGFNATSDGIEGWYDTPDPKWELTEKLTQDGAFSIEEDEMLYSAKSVEMHLYAEGENRWEVLANAMRLKSLSGQSVTATMFDEGFETSLSGMCRVTFEDGNLMSRHTECTLTMECPVSVMKWSPVTYRHPATVCVGTTSTSGNVKFSGTIDAVGDGDMWPLIHVWDEAESGGDISLRVYKGSNTALAAEVDGCDDLWIECGYDEGPEVEAWSGWEREDVEFETLKSYDSYFTFNDGDAYSFRLYAQSGQRIRCDLWFRSGETMQHA